METATAAAQLGRLGGKKGGKARAAAMTPKQRSESARKAAKARWDKQKTLDTAFLYLGADHDLQNLKVAKLLVCFMDEFEIDRDCTDLKSLIFAKKIFLALEKLGHADLEIKKDRLVRATIKGVE